MNAESPWWRVEQAAEYARVHKSVLFRACRSRQLEHVRVSGKRMILTKQEFIDSWLNGLRVHVKPAGKDAATVAYGDARA